MSSSVLHERSNPGQGRPYGGTKVPREVRNGSGAEEELQWVDRGGTVLALGLFRGGRGDSPRKGRGVVLWNAVSGVDVPKGGVEVRVWYFARKFTIILIKYIASDLALRGVIQPIISPTRMFRLSPPYGTPKNTGLCWWVCSSPT